jgi:FxsC-like protein
VPQFFLSRAVGDDDRYVTRFFRDLSLRVGELTRAHGDVGYLRPADGPAWPNELLEALSSCQAFVELRSPASVLSQSCAVERGLFAERLRRHIARGEPAVDALIPVIWSKDPVDLPTDAGKVGELIRNRAARPEYEALLTDVAARIAALVAAGGLAQADGNLDPARVAIEVADASSSRQVHFVVAAAGTEEMSSAQVRSDLRFYGEEGRDWHPYDPATHASPLADQACAVAADLLFGADVSDLRQLAERVEAARQHNHIVVLLVDSWVTRLPARREQLSSLAKTGEATVALLAPLSAADPETLSHRDELRSGLSKALPIEITEREVPSRWGIDTSEAFVENLTSALEEAQNRIFSRGRVFRRPAVENSMGRPILQGP